MNTSDLLACLEISEMKSRTTRRSKISAGRPADPSFQAAKFELVKKRMWRKSRRSTKSACGVATVVVRVSAVSVGTHIKAILRFVPVGDEIADL